MLERNDVAGGCIRTSTDLTLPGFTHEVLASWHPLFTGSAAYAELEGELTARGVVYVNTDLPTGTAFPDGSAAFITGSLEGNVAEFDRLAPGDGVAWERQFNEFMGNADLAFGILSTELWSTAGLTLGRKALRRLGRRGLLEFAGNTLVSCRDWVSTTFESEAAHGVLAPWVLHTGLGPDQATSGFMTQVIGAALQLGGMPVPVGGGVRLVDALAGIVTDAGGEVRLSADVRQILVANGRATGVRLTDGEVVAATRAVVANVTPTQLYGSLLGGSDVPTAVAEAAVAVPLRTRGDADPPGARRAAALEGQRRRAPRPLPDRPRHARSRRRLARGQRGGARAAAGRGHDRLRPARRARPLARAGRQVDHLDPAAGASGRPDQGRRCRRARHGRRHLERRARRGVRRPDRGPPRRLDREPRCRDAEARRRLASWRSRRSTGISSAATSTAARARSTRTCSGARLPRPRATRRPWPACGTSARARIPGRGSAPAPATSSPRS